MSTSQELKTYFDNTIGKKEESKSFLFFFERNHISYTPKAEGELNKLITLLDALDEARRIVEDKKNVLVTTHIDNFNSLEFSLKNISSDPTTANNSEQSNTNTPPSELSALEIKLNEQLELIYKSLNLQDLPAHYDAQTFFNACNNQISTFIDNIEKQIKEYDEATKGNLKSKLPKSEYATLKTYVQEARTQIKTLRKQLDLAKGTTNLSKTALHQRGYAIAKEKVRKEKTFENKEAFAYEQKLANHNYQYGAYTEAVETITNYYKKARQTARQLKSILIKINNLLHKHTGFVARKQEEDTEYTSKKAEAKRAYDAATQLKRKASNSDSQTAVGFTFREPAVVDLTQRFLDSKKPKTEAKKDPQQSVMAVATDTADLFTADDNDKKQDNTSDGAGSSHQDGDNNVQLAHQPANPLIAAVIVIKDIMEKDDNPELQKALDNDIGYYFRRTAASAPEPDKQPEQVVQEVEEESEYKDILESTYDFKEIIPKIKEIITQGNPKDKTELKGWVLKTFPVLVNKTKATSPTDNGEVFYDLRMKLNESIDGNDFESFKSHLKAHVTIESRQASFQISEQPGSINQAEKFVAITFGDEQQKYKEYIRSKYFRSLICIALEDEQFIAKLNNPNCEDPFIIGLKNIDLNQVNEQKGDAIKIFMQFINSDWSNFDFVAKAKQTPPSASPEPQQTIFGAFIASMFSSSTDRLTGQPDSPTSDKSRPHAA